MLGALVKGIYNFLGPVGTIAGIASLLSGKKSIGEAARDAALGSVAGSALGLNDMFSGIFSSETGQAAAQTMQGKSGITKSLMDNQTAQTAAAGTTTPVVAAPQAKGALTTVLASLGESFKENPMGTLSGVMTLAGAVGALNEERPEAPDMSDPTMLETNPDYRGNVLNAAMNPITGKYTGGTATLDRPVMQANQGGFIQGPGTSVSDSINAGIFQNGRKVQEAKLSDGEFVMKADAVKGLGNGDRAKGAARMYALQNQFSRMA